MRSCLPPAQRPEPRVSRAARLISTIGLLWKPNVKHSIPVASVRQIKSEAPYQILVCGRKDGLQRHFVCSIEIQIPWTVEDAILVKFETKSCGFSVDGVENDLPTASTLNGRAGAYLEAGQRLKAEYISCKCSTWKRHAFKAQSAETGEIELIDARPVCA